MTTKEIQSIKMGTLLTHVPTGAKFIVTGFNEFKIKDGTETHVDGIECYGDGHYDINSMPCIYTLSKSEICYSK
jgi:hypothetical protein